MACPYTLLWQSCCVCSDLPISTVQGCSQRACQRDETPWQVVQCSEVSAACRTLRQARPWEKPESRGGARPVREGCRRTCPEEWRVIVDDITGQVFDARLVKKARQLETVYLERKRVYTKVRTLCRSPRRCAMRSFCVLSATAAVAWASNSTAFCVEYDKNCNEDLPCCDGLQCKSFSMVWAGGCLRFGQGTRTSLRTNVENA